MLFLTLMKSRCLLLFSEKLGQERIYWLNPIWASAQGAQPFSAPCWANWVLKQVSLLLQLEGWCSSLKYGMYTLILMFLCNNYNFLHYIFHDFHSKPICFGCYGRNVKFYLNFQSMKCSVVKLATPAHINTFWRQQI